MTRWLILLASLCLWPATVLGESETRHYLFGEYAVGGDELVDPDSGDSLYAGGGFQVSYGARFLSEELPNWAVDARIGYKFALVDVDGGDATFTRWAIELLVERRFGRLGIGLGPVVHLTPSYSLDVDAVDDEIDFEDAFGFAGQLDFLLGEHLIIGARYLDIEYEKDDATFILPDGDVVRKIDGSATGVYLIYVF